MRRAVGERRDCPEERPSRGVARAGVPRVAAGARAALRRIRARHARFPRARCLHVYST